MQKVARKAKKELKVKVARLKYVVVEGMRCLYDEHNNSVKQGKKGGKGKKSESAAKPKKCCDGEKALGDVSLQQCIDELTRLGIAQKLPENTKPLQDFAGDYNYLGF